MVIFKRNDSSSLWAKRGLLFSLGIDTGLGFILFCIALGISSFYIHWLQTTGLGEFYAPLKEPIQHFLYPIYPYGILFGIVQVLCFGIFRLGMGRPFSTLCSFALMTSSFQLNFLVPSIGRDYLKAPYILTIIFFMGLLVKVPLKGNLAVSLCILAAGIIGHGLGVRQDLLVLIVPFIMVWLFFRPEKIMSNWKQIVIGLVFFLCFLFLSMPQAVRTELHNSASHRLLGGLMRPHNDSLGVTNPGYDWGYLFLDEFIRSNAYVQDKARNPKARYTFQDDEFARISRRHFLNILSIFPADMLTRTYASIIKILELPFIYAAPPMGVDGPWVQRIYQGREIFLNFLMGFGVYFSVLTFLILSFFCFRTALFFLLFLLFFGGYPVLQFQGRHYFHLEFISWWTFGFLIQQMRTLVRFLQKNGFKSLQVYSLWNSKTRNVLTFVFFATIALTFPLFVLRSFQSHQVRNLLLEYTRAEKKPLTIKAISLNEKMVLLETPEFKKEFSHPYFDFKFLVAQFHRNHSDRSTVWPLFQYQYQDSSRWDFSRGIQMNLPKSEEEVTQFFLPVMKVPKMPNQDLETPNQSVFSGIQMPKKQLINLEGLYWVKDPSSFPIILSTQLFENGQSVSTHQKILRFQGKTCYSLPFTIEKGMEKKILTADLKSIAEEDIEFQANILRKVKNKWIIHGYAKAPMDSFLYPGADRSLSQTARVLFPDIQVADVDTDLLLTRKKWLKKGSYFRAKGKLYTGGITFGLIREGWSSGYVTVPHRGPFSVIIEVPEDGFYSLGLANRLNIFTSLENRLTLSQFGWVEKSEI